MNKLFVPRRGSNITCFSFSQNVIKTAFKKSLIYLVIFCFAFAPLFNVYNVFAQEFPAESAISQDTVLVQPNDQVFAEPLKDQLLNDALGDKSADLPNLDLPNGPDSDSTPDTETVNDPENPIEPQQQSLSQNSSSENGENPTGKVDGIYGSKPKIDLITGAMTYGYPISVPPGRASMTPDLQLNYNSQENDNGSVFGYSWGINIPYIERVNKNGSEKLYTQKNFTSSIDGELVEVSSGIYRPRVDSGSFHEYKFVNNTWEFTDKSGVVYKFGSSTGSRQDNSVNTSQVYKWMLEKQIDLNGNSISYEYYKDAGQIYPQKINYTNYGLNLGVFEVEFLRQVRPDTYVSYKTAFQVKTNYRINEVQVKLNSNWVKKYYLTYTSGDNGYRSLLESIIVSAKDKNGTITTLPQTKFTYQKTTPGWTENNNIWTSPVLLGDNQEIAIDIKGDSWVDFIKSIDRYGQNVSTGPFRYEKELYDHTTNKDWKYDGNFNIPTMFLKFEDRGGRGNVWDQGVRTADVNGDQLIDLVQSAKGATVNGVVRNDIFDTYLYSRANGWAKDTNWVPAIPFTGRHEIHDFGSHLIDLNGDTLPDIIRKQGGNIGEQLNIGSGFASVTQDWVPPIDELTFTTNRIVDINADGLADAVSKYWYNLTSPSFAYLNKGDTGWINNTDWLLPMILANSYVDMGVRFLDVNSDNLIDVVIDPANQTGGNRGTYLNTGNGWVYKPVWDLTVPEHSLMSGSAIVADIDSDGFIDFLRTQNSNPAVTVSYINNGNKIPDLLSRIEYGSGANSEIRYKKSAQYKDASGNLLNPNLSMNLNTVESITNNDGLGNISKTSYEYADGYYYYNNAFDRKFAGFGKVVETNPDNTKQISYYSQGNTTDNVSGEYDDHVSKIGRTYRTDTFDTGNNLIKQETTKWQHSQIGTANAYFVYPSQTMSRIFTGSNSYDTATGYDYNTNTGNLNSKTEYGNVTATGYQSFSDTGTDLRKTEYAYTNCTSSGCLYLQLPNRVVVRDYTNNKIAEQKMYYDNASFGVATAGNNTKTENWISGTNYATTQKTYNLFGMPTSVTDARNNTNNINYDIYNLYPSSVTNALSQTTSYVYDYNTGKVVRTFDANGMAAETDYDGFGRPTAERSSSDTSYSSLINTASYTYNDTMGVGGMVPYVQKTTNYSPTLSGTSYTLTDGLGREVRSITQSGPSSYVASDTVYDDMGRVIKKSLPYNLSGSPINYSGPTTNNNIITTNTYDSLGRITTSTNTLGTNTNIYNLNTTTTIDPENHSKDVVTDAFGNIISVIEHNGASTYTTNYNWDGLGNLISLTDALGNVRTFTYDAQGNRLSATDLHAPTDTAYGSYTYSYDANNNLVQKNTPNGDVVRYIYDALNRPTRESNNSVAQINYTYDSCANGIGKLCSVGRVGSSTKSFIYTNRGLLSYDTTILGTKNWLSSYVYNYAGNPIQITYPDNSSVRYAYDNRGLITQIEKQDTATGAWANVITNITYNPLGQKESVQYANGRTQNYTYDATKQYQITRNTLDAPTGYTYPNFIDTLYTFSPSGNLTQKTENFNLSNPQTFAYTYDGLSRLTGVTKTVNAPLTGYAESYTYNALGNIINKTGPGSYMYAGTNPGVYANPNAATSVGSINYNYDKNGNLTSWGTAPNNTALNYNYRNELTSYVKISAPAINNTYVYDYSGARIKTTTSAGITYSPSKYFDENATINKRYIYLNDQLVATVEAGGTGTPTINYIHPDYLGGTQMVTDSAGAIKKQDLEYYPFGEILSNTKMGGFDEKHKYTGHEYDTDTGLNFMQARYQSGKEGRFWQQDPIIRELDNQKLQILLTDPQRLNSYSYASNSPLRFVDPDGRTSREALENRPLITIALLFATYAGSRAIAGVASLTTQGTFMPSDFINHSLSLNNNNTVNEPENYSSKGNSLNRNFDPNSELSTKIGDSSEFRRAVEYKINGINQNSLQFDRSSDKNLGLSLQKTTINSLDVKETKNGYSVNANLSDNFLFVYNTEPGTRLPSMTPTGMINNYAALMQKAGVISPFTSNISISRNYSKEDLGIKK